LLQFIDPQIVPLKTKLVISLKKLSYKEHLLQLNLHTLKYRRLRGDMIEVYKIIHDMYDRSVALELPRNVSSTRCNKYKLQKHSFHYNFRKFSFAARVVNVWNSVPDHVVDVNSLKQFETRLDKFWSNQKFRMLCLTGPLKKLESETDRSLK